MNTLVTNSQYDIQGHSLSPDRLIDVIEDIVRKNEFTYDFFKDGVESVPYFLYNLNFYYLNDSIRSKSPQTQKVRSSIIKYSTYLLRDYIKNIDQNFRVIKFIPKVLGAEILINVLNYIDKKNIVQLPFSNYHLYNSPEGTLVHLLLESKPLKSELKNKYSLNLQHYSESSLLLVAIFAYEWRSFFEKSLNMKGFSDFLECFYQLNNYLILKQGNDLITSKGEVLMLPLNTLNPYLIDYKRFKSSISQLGLDNINKIISIVEVQKFKHLDLIFLLKAIAGLNKPDVHEEYNKKSTLGIIAYSLLEQENDSYQMVQNYISLWQTKTKAESSNDIENERQRAACDVALKYLSLTCGFDSYNTFILEMEKSIDKTREDIFQLEYHFDQYRFWVDDDDEKHKIIIFKKNRHLERTGALDDLEDYQNLQREIKYYQFHKMRLISLLEHFMTSDTQLNKEQAELFFQNQMLLHLATQILFINSRNNIGFYNIESQQLYSPVEETLFDLSYPIRLVHSISLNNSKVCDLWQKYYIERDIPQYFPQIFREFYFLQTLKLNKSSKKVLFKYETDKQSFFRHLSHQGWYCKINELAYKELSNDGLVVNLSFLDWDYDPDTNYDLQLDELYLTQHGKLIPLYTVSPILISEIIRNIEMALAQTFSSESDLNLLQLLKIKGDFFSLWIKYKKIQRVSINDGYLRIFGLSAHFRIHLLTEVVEILNKYHEWEAIDPSPWQGDTINNNAPLEHYHYLKKLIRFLHDEEGYPKKFKQKLNQISCK